ncbi:MAG: hypothetical protein F7C32_00715 [Desulfurococcales archaeon]|nr:hypothetical protein [Desulfurococcales archaeon]
MEGYDILIRGSLLLLDKTRFIKNAYIYIKNGVIEDYGEEPVPQDYEYATLVLGGENRVIAPAYGIPYTDALLYHIHPAERGTFEKRIKLIEKTDRETLLQSLYTVLYELSLHGVAVVGVETIEPSIVLEAAKTSKVKIVPIGCKSGRCIAVSRIEPSVEYDEHRIYIDKLEELMIYRNHIAPMFTKRFSYSVCALKPLELFSATQTAYALEGMKWGITKNTPAMITVYNFNDLPLYRAGLVDLFDLIRTCKRVETLIAGQEIIVDGGEHLTIGKRLVKDGG